VRFLPLFVAPSLLALSAASEPPQLSKICREKSPLSELNTASERSMKMIFERLEQRRTNFACAKRNLAGLTENFNKITIHENYLCGLTKEDFYHGMDALIQVFRTLYTGMISEPLNYVMKDSDDKKGLEKNMNFLFILAQKGHLTNGLIEIEGKLFALALKEAKITKPEIYFNVLNTLGFTTVGLGKKIESSEIITVEYPDSGYLFAVLRAMVDAIGMFSTAKPHQQSRNYFELLDYRVLENYPATEPKITVEYIMSKIKGESHDVVSLFYEFIIPHAKCQIKGSFGHYLTLTFTSKTTKKVIMSLKINLESHDVKLNLFNLGKYIEHLDGLSDKMRNEIKYSGWETNNEYAFVFELDGKSYRKDPESAFVFTMPSISESELLIGLLKKELEFIYHDITNE
ncbi:MAG: hypothetical protein FWC92_03675, partial [Defluviitaleaceae bacterium]|nr:hypothetical protein [Defluviitaleaceae bacterium]